ncbi:MAG: hypothetical protein JOS17DRAFT_341847 [Linnemannia elongata]|nr:MAG: hypothetical protein JOS17DRAFT_341847 [Linnemannia elongata]
MLACHSIRFFHLLSSTQQPSSPPVSPSSTSFFSHSSDQEPRQLSPVFISTTIATTSTKTSESIRPPSPTSIFSLADIHMPATPKAAVIGNGQKIATATPAASPAGSVARPSPSSAGMSTPAEAPSTPLSKNQKKKKSKAAKAAASAATTTAPVAAANGSVPSTPVANVKQQQDAPTSTNQQITPTVESLGLSEEKKTSAKGASPIARNILDAPPTSAKKETVTQPTPVGRKKPPKRALIAHTFQWKNGGGVVKVTGTFDNWGGKKSTKFKQEHCLVDPATNALAIPSSPVDSSPRFLSLSLSTFALLFQLLYFDPGLVLSSCVWG